MEDMILKIDIICGNESRTKAWVLLMKRKRVLRHTDLTEPFQGAFIKEKNGQIGQNRTWRNVGGFEVFGRPKLKNHIRSFFVIFVENEGFRL